MILHFQMTLPLLREANEAPGYFFYWFSASVSSLSRIFWKREKLFPGVVFFFVLIWARRGGGVAVRQTRQGKARQAVCNYDRISRGFLAGR